MQFWYGQVILTYWLWLKYCCLVSCQNRLTYFDREFQSGLYDYDDHPVYAYGLPPPSYLQGPPVPGAYGPPSYPASYAPPPPTYSKGPERTRYVIRLQVFAVKNDTKSQPQYPQATGAAIPYVDRPAAPAYNMTAISRYAPPLPPPPRYGYQPVAYATTPSYSAPSPSYGQSYTTAGPYQTYTAAANSYPAYTGAPYKPTTYNYPPYTGATDYYTPPTTTPSYVIPYAEKSPAAYDPAETPVITYPSATTKKVAKRTTKRKTKPKKPPTDEYEREDVDVPVRGYDEEPDTDSYIEQPTKRRKTTRRMKRPTAEPYEEEVVERKAPKKKPRLASQQEDDEYEERPEPQRRKRTTLPYKKIAQLPLKPQSDDQY